MTIHEYLSNLIDYDPHTGIFKAKISSKSRKANDKLGGLDADGYWRIKICGKTYRAGRLAWFLSFGVWPCGLIDHINGIRIDNRLNNLRIASPRQSVWNTKTRKTNKTGLKWVTRNGRGYRSAIEIDGKIIRLGTFETAEAAHSAAKKKAEELHGEFCNDGMDGLGAL